tara:strand:+ start:493 stop:636 length:144 start_codon:yes stop_codon:yes gene_type:complete
MPKAKTISTTVLLPEALHRELKVLSKEQLRTMSSQIVFMLHAFLKEN